MSMKRPSPRARGVVPASECVGLEDQGADPGSEGAEDLLEPQKGPPLRRIRRCAVSGQDVSPADAIRFVRAPNGEILTDPNAKLPGRGCWIKAERIILEQGIRKNVFSRAYKTEVALQGDFLDRVEHVMAQMCLARLGLMRKSGQLLIGYDTILLGALKTPPHLLILAKDGSPRQQSKLLARLRQLGAHPQCCTGFSSQELAVALGRQVVIQVACAGQKMSDSWIGDYLRWDGVRSPSNRQSDPGAAFAADGDSPTEEGA